jgi:hypothetical protein
MLRDWRRRRRKYLTTPERWFFNGCYIILGTALLVKLMVFVVS